MSLEEKTIRSFQVTHQTGMKGVGQNGTSQCGEVSSGIITSGKLVLLHGLI